MVSFSLRRLITEGFGFSIAPGTVLRADAEGYFLTSAAPLRILRINESLYRLLERIKNGGDLSDFTRDNPVMNQENIVRVLLMLVGGGYLKLDKIAPLTEFPRVSVIIPVRDMPDDLRECLDSLEKLNYLKDTLEIIVVDDGSKERVTAPPHVKVIRNEVSRGPAACRNIGAQNAAGEIFAFLDADCLARENWLAETVPFLQMAGVGAVGGFVDGYYRKTYLDRYEKAYSSLNTGKRLIIEAKGPSGFYVPSANLLVTRRAFGAAGGFKEDLRLGEDVDFCWRLREKDIALLYVPCGSVAHKHRNELAGMLKRRFEYGTSEAPLYRAHKDKKKTFPFPPYAALSLLALILAVLMLSPYPLCAIPPLFAIDMWRRSVMAKKYKVSFKFWALASSILRSDLSFGYYVSYHVVRYYLVLFIGLGVLWPPLWIVDGLMIIWASVTDDANREPELLYPYVLFYYILEQLVYQAGVFWGCVKTGYFGSYIVKFRRG